MRADDEMSVQEHDMTHVPFPHPSASESIPPDVPVGSVSPDDSAQLMSTRRIKFQRPPKPSDRAEPPKRIRSDDDEGSALLSAYHHDVEKVSEKFEGCFSGTRMPDMLGLRSKSRLRDRKSEPTTESQSVEPLQRDVDNLLVTMSFSLDNCCNNSAIIPIQKQPAM